MSGRIKSRSSRNLGLLYGIFMAAPVFIRAAADQPNATDDSWWKEEQVSRVSIRVAAEGLSSLRNDPRQKISATVRFDQEPLAEAGLHLKGSVGSFRPID